MVKQGRTFAQPAQGHEATWFLVSADAMEHPETTHLLHARHEVIARVNTARELTPSTGGKIDLPGRVGRSLCVEEVRSPGTEGDNVNQGERSERPSMEEVGA